MWNQLHLFTIRSFIYFWVIGEGIPCVNRKTGFGRFDGNWWTFSMSHRSRKLFGDFKPHINLFYDKLREKCFYEQKFVNKFRNFRVKKLFHRSSESWAIPPRGIFRCEISGILWKNIVETLSCWFDEFVD